MNTRSMCVPAGRVSPGLLTCTALLLPGLWTDSAACAQASSTKHQPVQAESVQLQQALQGLSMAFEANGGQFDPRVAFASRTFAGPVFVTRDGAIVYSLPAPASQGGWSFAETLVEAMPLAPAGAEQASMQVSRFVGPQSYQAATYRSVLLGQAWPGIEVELAARGGNVEKLFHVAPHADAGRIQVLLKGALALRLGDGGELVARTGHGDVAYTAPVAFQEVEGRRVGIPVKYTLNAEGNGYGFALDAYDRTRPLVIDPLLQSTYLGGSGYDSISALAIDSATGDVVVSGDTSSADFPGTEGGAQPDDDYYEDGFVARLSGDLKTLYQTTYLGGYSIDSIQDLALDAASGDVVVAGYTYSRNFPGTAGSAQPGLAGYKNGFVARLSGNLQTLRQASYLGGSEFDHVAALALDAATGDVILTGHTHSPDLPGTAGSIQPGLASTQSGFVARLSGDLQTLHRASYLGGSDAGYFTTLALDAATGDVVVGGNTSATDFPGISGGAQSVWTGGIVARLAGDLKALRQASYLGGSDWNHVSALALDRTNGDVIVTGETSSTDFPGTAGSVQPGLAGFQNGFIARLSGDLKTLRQASYLGGSEADYFTALVLDAATDDVVVVGDTFSKDFPGTAGGAQPTHAGGRGSDGFVARLSGNLKTLRQASYLGGSNPDFANTLVLDTTTGNVVVAGDTVSTDFPMASGGAQAAYGGGSRDGVITRLTGDLRAVSPQEIAFPPQAPQEFVAGASFTIDPPAVASSGLPVSYASSTSAVCMVSGSTVTMVSPGTCTVVASQGGNAQWNPATDAAADIALTQDNGANGEGNGGESGGGNGNDGGEGGTGPARAAPVPAMDSFSLALMSLLAGGLGCGWLRRR